MAKVQISINDDLLERIDQYCKQNFIARGFFISLIASKHLQTEQLMQTLAALQAAMEAISTGRELTPEQEQELEEYKRIVSGLGKR